MNISPAPRHPDVLLRQTGDRSCSTGLHVFVCQAETRQDDDMSSLMARSVVSAATGTQSAADRNTGRLLDRRCDTEIKRMLC